MTIRIFLTALLAISYAAVYPPAITMAVAQEKNKDGSEEPVDETEEKSVSAVEQIRDLLKAQKPAAAAEVLERALESESVDAELRRMHQSIAFGFLSKRNYDEATTQLKRWFDLELPLTDSPRSARALAGIVQTMSVYGANGSRAKIVAEVTERAMDRFRELEADYPVEMQIPLTQLIVRRAAKLVREDKAAAEELIDAQIEKLDEINASDNVTEETISAAINVISTRGNLFEDDDARARVDILFEEALESYPESSLLQNQYASHEYATIRRLSREDPDAASQRMEAAMKTLEPLAENSPRLKSTVGRIAALESRIESTRIQQRLIGQPAPELKIDAWVNTEGMTVEDLRGKVVLYDFWAVWCGPCIATFPHLRELRDEFSEQGFEIVGITRYYGYTWDEENETTVRSREEVEPELEQIAVEKFLQSKNMQHPSVITPKTNSVHEAFGVTGIPHAVLVDRQGNVQMIKVGSGKANADALHAKIEELIAEPVPSS